MKKGTIKRTSWKPGQSGNAVGRPKADPELVEAFRGRTPRALTVLDQILDAYLAGPCLDDNGLPVQPPRAEAAIRAAEIVLERGWGKAPTEIHLSTPGTPSRPINYKALSTEQLDQLIEIRKRSDESYALTDGTD